jgi:hypothetical protein
MATNYTLLGNALKPVFATTGHQLPLSEPGSSDRRRSVLANVDPAPPNSEHKNRP